MEARRGDMGGVIGGREWVLGTELELSGSATRTLPTEPSLQLQKIYCL